MFMLILLFIPLQDDVPMLSSDEYSYKLEYSLRQKDNKTPNKVYDANRKIQASSAMLPFVEIHFSLDNFLPTDKRVRIFHGDQALSSKKIKGPMKLTLEMGFSADLKEKTVPSIFRIYILDENRNPRGQIKVEVKSDGELLINEVTSGMI